MNNLLKALLLRNPAIAAVLLIGALWLNFHKGVYSFKRYNSALEHSDIVGGIVDICAQIDGVVHQQTSQRGVGIRAKQTVTNGSHIDKETHVGEIDAEPTLHSCLCQPYPLITVEIAHLLSCELMVHSIGSNAGQTTYC